MRQHRRTVAGCAGAHPQCSRAPCGTCPAQSPSRTSRAARLAGQTRAANPAPRWPARTRGRAVVVCAKHGRRGEERGGRGGGRGRGGLRGARVRGRCAWLGGRVRRVPGHQGEDMGWQRSTGRGGCCVGPEARLVHRGEEVLVAHGEGLGLAKVVVLGVVVHDLRLRQAHGRGARLGQAVKGDKAAAAQAA